MGIFLLSRNPDGILNLPFLTGRLHGAVGGGPGGGNGEDPGAVPAAAVSEGQLGVTA